MKINALFNGKNRRVRYLCLLNMVSRFDLKIVCIVYERISIGGINLYLKGLVFKFACKYINALFKDMYTEHQDNPPSPLLIWTQH